MEITFVQPEAPTRKDHKRPVWSACVLGAHVSVAGGLTNAFIEAKSLKCEAIQIFSKNQRQWQSKPLEAETVDGWRVGRSKIGVRSVMIHGSYLINLADPTRAGVMKARAAFIDEMERAETLEVPYLVFHPGAHMGRGEEAGINRVIESLDYCISHGGAKAPMLLIENTAGQGSSIGHRMEQLAAIIQGVSDPSRLGICLDTCHFFAAGYGITTPEGYEDVMGQVDDILGLSRVKAFHLNDSKKGLNCRVDRHEHIGKGLLGLEAFRCLVNDPEFRDTPMVLETPGDLKDFRRNLKVLRSLRRPA